METRRKTDHQVHHRLPSRSACLFHAGKAQNRKGLARISITSSKLSQLLQMSHWFIICTEYRCLVQEGRQTAPRKHKCRAVAAMFQPKARTTPSKAARAEKSMPLEQAETSCTRASDTTKARIKCRGEIAATEDAIYVGVYVASNMTDDIHILLLLLPK